MATGVLTMSLPEAAAWLVDHGLYTSLEAAYQAAPSWTTYATAEGGLDFLTSYGISYSGGAAAAASSTTETALAVAQSHSLVATGERITTMGTSLSRVSGGFSYNALMAVDVGLVGAAAAPLLGVKLGVDLYQSNPELWTKLSQKLLPFCYPGTTQIPTWAEIAGATWTAKVARDVIDALKDLFDEENIPTVDTHTGTVTNPNYPGISAPYGSGTMFSYERGSGLNRRTGSITSTAPFVRDVSGSIITGSPYGYSVTITETIVSTGVTTSNTTNYDGGTTYSPSTTGLRDISWGVEISTLTARQAYNILTSPNSSYSTPGEYQPGTSKWTGTQYPSSSIPAANPIVRNSTGSLIDTVPISLPINVPATWKPGTPVESNNPDEYPDPAETYNPQTQVEPYIYPWTLPDITTVVTDIKPLPETSDPSDPIPPKTSIRDLIPEIPPSGISPFPNMPSTDVSFSQNRGLVTVYHPTSQQLYSFEDWLWVTYNDATIDKIFNNPFDGVITLFELYCTPTDVGSRNIHSGFLDSGINSAVISRYTQIDCGTLGIPEYYGNYFDYSPYTKAHIYLPFIGIVELNPDDIVGHGVNVTYRIDEYNGSCIAMITVAKSTEVNGERVDYSCTMYQYSGNCAVELPLAGGTQASIRAGMMQADAWQTAANVSAGVNLVGGIASILGAAAAGSVGAAMGGLSQGLSSISSYYGGQASALSNMLSGKSTVSKSGSFGSSHGALGIKTPYIVVTRPKQIKVADYQDLYGFPAHKMVVIGDCTGFLRCREVHVVSSTATDAEKSAIETLLKSGVYVTEE